MLLRVFPRRTSATPDDALAYVGDPPLFPIDGVTEIHVSVCFTWDKAEGERLAEAWQEQYPQATVRVGGPAYGDPGNGFTPGRYLKAGHVHTSRGCIRKCPFCLVPIREGGLRLMAIAYGNVIADNNILACPRQHRREVYRMLAKQPKAAVFSGGLDCRLLDDERAAELRDVRIDSVFLACDSEAGLPPLAQAVERLRFLKRRQLRCYVLVGYGDDTPDLAAHRLEACWQIGVLPFAQFYRPPTAERRFDYPAEWRALVRTWSRPAAMIAAHKETE